MVIERIGRIRTWWKEQLEFNKEYSRFSEFFWQYRSPDGVLAKPDEEIDPIKRGFATAPDSYSLMKKSTKGKGLSAKERKSVREAAWLNSLTGTYEFQCLPEGEVETRILIESDDVMDYLLEHANKDTMVAFLSYRGEKHYRHIEFQS